MSDIYWEMGDKERLELAEYTWGAFDSFYRQEGAEELPMEEKHLRDYSIEYLIDRIKHTEHTKWGLIRKGLTEDCFGELEVHEEGDMIKTSSKFEGHLFTALERIGVVDQWGGKKSPYKISDPDAITRFEEVFEKNMGDQRDTSKAEI